MIELKNVNKYYNSNGTITVALRNVNLKLSKGEVVAITGPSGAGKSTLLNVICGVDKYEEGEIYFKGEETSYFNQNDMDVFRKNHIGFIYQSYNIIDSYTVLENVMLPLILKGEKYEEAKEKALHYIEKVGLSHRINNKGIKLSGGEKQRCVIARALAQDFEILACDEPTGNLDSETGKQIIDLIKEVASDKLVLIVTHNYDQVKDIVTRTIKVSDAEIIEDKIIESKEDNEEAPLNLVEKQNKLKSLFLVSSLNVKNTPKKTIFTSIVFMVFSFVLFLLLLTSIAWNDMNAYTPNTHYYNTIYERIVVYNADHSKIDIDDFKDFEEELYYNSFYEDIKLNFRAYYNINDRAHASSSMFGALTSHIPYEYINVCGNLPIKENDCYILFPTSKIEKFSDEFVKYINKPLLIQEYKLNNLEMNLSGFGYSDTVTNITLIVNQDVSEMFYQLYLSEMKAQIIVEDKEYNVNYFISDSYNKPRLVYFYENEIDLSNLRLIFKNIYKIEVDNLEVDYFKCETEHGRAFTIYVPFNFEFDEIFELSIYSNDFKTTLKKLDDLGYSYRLPGKNGVIPDSKENLYYILFLLVAGIACVILYFITYVIVSKIFTSKLKDYTILRSNGVLKKSMKNIIHFEVLLIGIISMVMAYSLVYLLSLNIDIFSSFINYNNIIISLVYVLLNTIFFYFISKRLNKKIFKNTIASSFKSEVTNND